MDLRQLIEKSLPYIIKLRHQLHQNPELSFEEYQTAALIQRELEGFGYEVQVVAKTGLVATLDSGKPGKTVGLRADIDALPLSEQTDLIYKSSNSGKMHACGHDGHTATLLLVAKVLQELKDTFVGKIKLIFQPAEEIGQGALAMIKQGVLTNPPVDAIFGYHNLPTKTLNNIYVKKDCIMAGRMVISITISGTAAHSSTPEKAVDPIYIGSLMVASLNSMVNQNFSAFDRIVIAMTRFSAGTAVNIIPGEAILEGTIRFTNNQAIEGIQKKITTLVCNLANSFGGSAKVNFPDVAPATINTATEVDLVYNTALALFGADCVKILQHNVMASEDFAFFLNEVPGCFFFVGTGEEKSYIHSSTYTFADNILPVAAELLATTALNY
jgi:amidohydrolase